MAGLCEQKTNTDPRVIQKTLLSNNIDNVRKDIATKISNNPKHQRSSSENFFASLNALSPRIKGKATKNTVKIN